VAERIDFGDTTIVVVDKNALGLRRPLGQHASNGCGKAEEGLLYHLPMAENQVNLTAINLAMTRRIV
jgi:hypothetical protein